MIHIHYDAQATEGAGGRVSEGNKLIARFMKREIITTRWPDVQTKLRYHNSWDWLMPVVEKIASTPMEKFIDEKNDDGGYAYPVTFGMRTEIGEWMVRFRGHGLHDSDTLISATWLAVIEFIKWHNEQKQQQQP